MSSQGLSVRIWWQREQGELDMSNQGLFLKTFRQRKGGGERGAGLTDMSNQGLLRTC